MGQVLQSVQSITVSESWHFVEPVQAPIRLPGPESAGHLQPRGTTIWALCGFQTATYLAVRSLVVPEDGHVGRTDRLTSTSHEWLPSSTVLDTKGGSGD